MAKKLKKVKTPKTYEEKVNAIKGLVDCITCETSSYEIMFIIKSIRANCGANFMTKVWADALLTQKYIELTFAEILENPLALPDDEFTFADEIMEYNIAELN